MDSSVDITSVEEIHIDNKISKPKVFSHLVQDNKDGFTFKGKKTVVFSENPQNIFFFNEANAIDTDPTNLLNNGMRFDEVQLTFGNNQNKPKPIDQILGDINNDLDFINNRIKSEILSRLSYNKTNNYGCSLETPKEDVVEFKAEPSARVAEPIYSERINKKHMNILKSIEDYSPIMTKENFEQEYQRPKTYRHRRVNSKVLYNQNNYAQTKMFE